MLPSPARAGNNVHRHTSRSPARDPPLLLTLRHGRRLVRIADGLVSLPPAACSSIKGNGGGLSARPLPRAQQASQRATCRQPQQGCTLQLAGTSGALHYRAPGHPQRCCCAIDSPSARSSSMGRAPPSSSSPPAPAPAARHSEHSGVPSWERQLLPVLQPTERRWGLCRPPCMHAQVGTTHTALRGNHCKPRTGTGSVALAIPAALLPAVLPPPAVRDRAPAGGQSHCRALETQHCELERALQLQSRRGCHRHPKSQPLPPVRGGAPPLLRGPTRDTPTHSLSPSQHRPPLSPTRTPLVPTWRGGAPPRQRGPT